ncbi:MAG: protein kinase [Gemmatimonadaceae bacterium]|nr:protein kinase [Gemmatimonadaceae bacterium]
MRTVDSLRTALADRYELLRELGAGGMATVYLARDVRHAREVAIKVLHPELAAVLGAERFLSEIRTTASLQHPHILPLFDSGEAAGQLFYVMPFVDGETLRSRLEREKQLPIADAVQLAREVADALQYAHDRGIIHRDIKPENILLQGGHALVADFGIALAVTNAGGARMTQTGLSLGTPQYMAPEQAMGERTIDARADIYALGAVTYEMLAGEPPFTGPTSQAIVAKVMSTEPQRLDVLRRNVPANAADAVHHALEKLPADRPASARALAEALVGAGPARRASGAARDRTTPAPVERSRPAWRAALLSVAAVALVGVGTQLPVTKRLGTTATVAAGGNGVIRAPLPLATDEQLNSNGLRMLAVSPAGDRIAYVTVGPDGLRLYVRDQQDVVPRRLEVDGVGGQLVFSPDGNALAYAIGAEIRRIGVRAGRSERIALSPERTSLTMRGLLWLPGDTLLMAVDHRGLWQVTPGASDATPVDTSAAVRVLSFPVLAGSPRWLVATQQDSAKKLMLTAYDRTTRRLVPMPTLSGYPAGLVGDRLLFVNGANTLQMVRVDTVTWQPLDSPTAVSDDPVLRSGSITTMAAVSPSGTVLTVHGTNDRELVLGRARGDSLLLPEARLYANPRISPDGKKIVVTVRGESGPSMWILDRGTGLLTAVTDGSGRSPEWSRDGRVLQFVRSGADERSAWTFWRVPADNSAAPTLIETPPELADEMLDTPDGRLRIYRTTPAAPHPTDVLVRPIDGSAPARVLESGPDVMRHLRLSPDGRWLAFQSNRSGKDQVYVRPFPGPGGAVPITGEPSREPMWTPDGAWLFYRLNAGIVRRRWSSSTGTPGPEELLLTGDYASEPRWANYDVLPGGDGVVALRRAGGPPRGVITFNVQRLWETAR